MDPEKLKLTREKLKRACGEEDIEHLVEIIGVVTDAYKTDADLTRYLPTVLSELACAKNRHPFWTAVKYFYAVRSDPAAAKNVFRKYAELNYKLVLCTKEFAMYMEHVKVTDKYLGTPAFDDFTDSIDKASKALDVKVDECGKIFCGYIRLDDILTLEPSTQEDFSGWFLESDDRQLERLEKVYKKEHEFIRNQTPETIAPLSFIMTELQDNYHEQIKGLDDYSRQTLAKAWGIAKNNKKDEKTNYLPEFYTGLKETLDKSPDQVGRWATAIIEGFKNDDSCSINRIAEVNSHA